MLWWLPASVHVGAAGAYEVFHIMRGGVSHLFDAGVAGNQERTAEKRHPEVLLSCFSRVLFHLT